MKQLFQVTERLITDQKEISGLTTIDHEQPVWRGTTLLCDKAGEITRDRVAELMMIKFSESGHPVFRAMSPLSRGTLKSKSGGKL